MNRHAGVLPDQGFKFLWIRIEFQHPDPGLGSLIMKSVDCALRRPSKKNEMKFFLFKFIIEKMENFPDRGVWIRVRFVMRGWFRIR